MNILICGVYGVGKSYLTSKIANFIDIPIYTASQLIRHTSILKSVQSVDDNQKRLIEAVSKINEVESSIVIDGHCCILNKNNEIEIIDAEVFKQLNLKKMIVLYDSVDEIEKRLLNRDGFPFSKSLIENMQEIELNHAECISRELSVPLLKVQSGDYESVYKIIDFIND